jgi:hypothetical protein
MWSSQGISAWSWTHSTPHKWYHKIPCILNIQTGSSRNVAAIYYARPMTNHNTTRYFSHLTELLHAEIWVIHTAVLSKIKSPRRRPMDWIQIWWMNFVFVKTSDNHDKKLRNLGIDNGIKPSDPDRVSPTTAVCRHVWNAFLRLHQKCYSDLHNIQGQI